MVIRNGIITLEKTRVVYLLDLSEERGDNGRCDLVGVECLWMIGLIMVVMLMSYSRVVSVVLVFSGVDLHTLNFLHSSLSVIQQEIFKKIVLVVHT